MCDVLPEAFANAELAVVPCCASVSWRGAGPQRLDRHANAL
jgi:hypothetical protein